MLTWSFHPKDRSTFVNISRSKRECSNDYLLSYHAIYFSWCIYLFKVYRRKILKGLERKVCIFIRTKNIFKSLLFLYILLSYHIKGNVFDPVWPKRMVKLLGFAVCWGWATGLTDVFLVKLSCCVVMALIELIVCPESEKNIKRGDWIVLSF